MDRIKNIIDIIKENKEISDFKLIRKKTSSKELFLIRDQVDMDRSVETDDVSVTIYADTEEDGKKFRGDSSFNTAPSDSDEEIARKVALAYERAKFIKNKYFPLAEGTILTDEKDYINELETIKKLKDIVYKDYGTKSKINSCEIFVNNIEENLVNSKSCDCKSKKSEIIVESIADACGEAGSIEVYRMFTFSKLNEKEFEENIYEELKEAEDRAMSKLAEPIESVDVIITGLDVPAFFSFYDYQASGSTHYMKLNKLKLNEEAHKGAKGDLVNITLKPEIEGSVHNSKYDSDGVKLKETQIFKDGKMINLSAGQRFASYMGIEPTGNLVNIEVAPGSMSIDEMRKTRHLEIKSFSSFQADASIGIFGGEFRLAKYFDGKETKIINNGAFSANIMEKGLDMYFSKEMIHIDNYYGPKYILIKDVNIG